jgi:hypothetical protein
MDKNYPILLKLGIALVLSCLALFLPFMAAKIVFAGIAGVLFALCFKKFKVLMIIFFVLVMLIMSATYYVHDFLSGMNLPWFMQREWFMRNGQEFSVGFGSRVQLINPDKESVPDKNLTIKGNSFRINFKDDIESIVYPSEMIVSKENEEDLLILDSRSSDGNRTLMIDVPSHYPFENIKLYGQFATMMGNTIADDIEYHIDALNVQGDYHTNHLFVKTSVLNWSGLLDGGDFIFEAEAANINGDVEKLRHFEFESEVLNGNLYFKEHWDGERVVELKAALGKFDIRRPTDRDSVLYVNREGEMFSVNVSEYNYSRED